MELFSLTQVAQYLNVSVASVHNWVKLGLLPLNTKGKICRKTLEDFQVYLASSEKLTKRANKSLLDTHQHSKLREHIRVKLQETECPIDEISNFYENSLSNSYRNKQGIYYTPTKIIQDFFDTLPKDRSKLTFCDPCCGTGNFLVLALKNGFKPENIYGFDTDETALAIASARTYEGKQLVQNQLQRKDFLKSFANINQKFDVIFTNPPWGKKLSLTEKKLMTTLFHMDKSTDTCSLFIFASIQVSCKGGYLGMLLPDSFFTVGKFEASRKKILEFEIIQMCDYGKPFRKLMTKAKGLIFKNQSVRNNHQVKCLGDSKQYLRKQSSFYGNPKVILNFSLSPQSQKIIQELYKKPYCSLKDHNTIWALGIITGNNKKHIQKNPFNGSVPVLKGSDIHSEGIKKPSHYLNPDLSLYQQTASEDLYNAPEKIIYRFISSKLVFYHDTEQHLVLNSANLLILDKTFPVAGKILVDFLNGDFMSWLFQSIFETTKVLRSDLEQLPIFYDFLSKQSKYEEENLLTYLGVKKTMDGKYTPLDEKAH